MEQVAGQHGSHMRLRHALYRSTDGSEQAGWVGMDVLHHHVSGSDSQQTMDRGGITAWPWSFAWIGNSIGKTRWLPLSFTASGNNSQYPEIKEQQCTTHLTIVGERQGPNMMPLMHPTAS